MKSKVNRVHLAVKNSGWLLFDKIVRMGLGILVGAWVARYLGPDKYGVFAYSLAFLSIFQAVAVLGLDGIVIRNLSVYKEDKGKILGTTFILRFIAGFGSFIIAFCYIVITNGLFSLEAKIISIVGVSLFFQAFDTVDLWFQSNSQSKRTVKIKMAVYFLSNALKVVAILLGADLIFFAWISLVEFVLIAIGLLLSYSKFRVNQKLVFSLSEAKVLLKESWPFIISGVSIMIYMRIDQVMIKHYLGLEFVGLYAAVLPLSTVWNFIPVILATSFAPLVAEAKNKSEKEYINLLSKLFRVVTIISLLLSVTIAMLAPFIISVLYGDKYIMAKDVLVIHVFTNVFIGLGVIQNLWIINEGKSKITLYKTIIGMIFCLVANSLLIPAYGIVGAAVVALSSQLISSVLCNVLFAPSIFIMQCCSLFMIRKTNEL
ncbi:TPA: flippase [Photobacterium damselae]